MHGAEMPDKKFMKALLLGTCVLGSGGCVLHHPNFSKQAHVIFLPAKVMEGNYGSAVSPRYGLYDNDGIVRALSGRDRWVSNLGRPANADEHRSADEVIAKVRWLEGRGVSRSQITIVGTSRGALIAMLASTRLADPRLSYVLLGNCRDWVLRTYSPRVSGRILSIYDAADENGGTCRPIVEQGTVSEFKEIELRTGLGHGFLYRPYDAWVGPAGAWADRSSNVSYHERR